MTDENWLTNWYNFLDRDDVIEINRYSKKDTELLFDEFKKIGYSTDVYFLLRTYPDKNPLYLDEEILLKLYYIIPYLQYIIKIILERIDYEKENS